MIEKEEPIALITAPKYATLENAGLVTLKEQLLLVNAENHKELLNVVKKGKYSNVARNAKKFLIAIIINANATVMQDNVFLARRNIWFHAIVGNQMI